MERGLRTPILSWTDKKKYSSDLKDEVPRFMVAIITIGYRCFKKKEVIRKYYIPRHVVSLFDVLSLCSVLSVFINFLF